MGAVSNLNALKGSVPIKRLKNTVLLTINVGVNICISCSLFTYLLKYMHDPLRCSCKEKVLSGLHYPWSLDTSMSSLPLRSREHLITNILKPNVEKEL